MQPIDPGTTINWGPSPLRLFYRAWYVREQLRRFMEDRFMMEKQGVVAGEGEAPAKQASDACCDDPCKPACGTDPLSKAADAVAEKAACEKEIKDK